MSSTSGRTVLIVVILLSAVLLAAGNILCHALVVQELTGSAPPSEPDLLSQIVHSIGASARPAPAVRLVLHRRPAAGRRGPRAARRLAGRGERARRGGTAAGSRRAIRPPTARCACSPCCSRKAA